MCEVEETGTLCSRFITSSCVQPEPVEGGGVGVGVGVGEMILREHVAVAESGEPPAPGISESTAFAVKVAVPGANGIPAIAPEAAVSVSPPGSPPALMEKV